MKRQLAILAAAVGLAIGASGATIELPTVTTELTLTYAPTKGTFKGSFKVFAMQGTKLKKYTVNVSGVVVDGVGYGVATSKKPSISWPMSVE